MAKETKIIIRDDLDGTEGASSYTFAWGKDQYEIDLSDANAKEFEDVLSKYIDAAAKVTARLPREAGSRSASSGPSKEELKKMRIWARENGMNVSGRGRVSQKVQDAYKAAH
ncbi:Lsr2 family protein [Arthrobacter sp. EpRS71]|uniref:histone-like nucleoid-structuring protein Lsr2 n=1 Tax=Arthrobacter sp. EpRS71 TaxID=1743141 RepID=UPI000748860F|nr:Lsr2 family protein [Arthrobacter sp. EpRS71]KUM39029.1 hypothetical protein AR689_07695 [Arthrobacter sp. EpRS71]